MNLWVVYQNEKTNKRWKIEPQSKPWVIGTSKESHLRIVKPGEDVIFGAFLYENKEWKYLDLTTPHDNEKLKREYIINGPTDVLTDQIKLKVIPLSEKPVLLNELERKNLKDFGLIQNSLNQFKKLHWSHLFEKEAAPFLGVAFILSFIIILTGIISSQKINENKVDGQKTHEVILRTIELQKQMPMKSKALEKAMKDSVAPKHIQQSAAASLNQSKKVIGSIFNKIQSRSFQRILKNVTLTPQSKNVVVGSFSKTLSNLSKSLPDNQVLTNTGVGTGSGKGVGTVNIGTVGINGTGVAGTYGKMDHGGVGKANVGIIPEETDVTGGLDRQVIADYIQTQLGSILFCYERQLSANPNLFGKVSVKFSIKGDGLIESSTVSETTLRSKAVESCLLSQINKWKFPKPKNGTTVVVTYPFMFKSVN